MSSGGGSHGRNVNAARVARMNARLRETFGEREIKRRKESHRYPLTVGTPRRPGLVTRLMLRLRSIFGVSR